MLTVGEAARALRVGRTKAYAMSREWRDTNGQSGLPVVGLGRMLRVPRAALEELLGTELATPTGPGPVELGEDPEPDGQVSRKTPAVEDRAKPMPRPRTVFPPDTARISSPRRSRRHRRLPPNQLDLFGPDLPTS